MRSIVRWALVALFFIATPAMAQNATGPAYVLNSMTQCGGVITSGGSSQTLISAATNAGTKFLEIINLSNTEGLMVDFGRAAAASSLIVGTSTPFVMGVGGPVWNGLITVSGTTTGHAFSCIYGQ